MKLKKLICIVMVSVLGVLSFAGCAKKQDEKKTETSSEASTQEASAQVFAMDTYMNLKAYGKNAQKAVDDAKSENYGDFRHRNIVCHRTVKFRNF